jgi:lipopolysaccharide biosynthesis protein/predicted O-methyltransferase YrrM/predicted nuclease with TOPRIM domain
LEKRLGAQMNRRGELTSLLAERARTKSDINEHLDLLYEIAAYTRARKIVELGTRGGNSTIALLAGAVETEGHVISVDWGKGAEHADEPPTWDALAQTSTLITDKLGLGDYWRLVIADTAEFAREYDDEIDLLFIDTGHSYDQTKKELDVWGRKVVNGGFIILHDTVSFPEQNKAIWDFLDDYPSSDFVEHKNCNGLGIIIKDTTRRSLNEGAVSTLLQQRINRIHEALLERRSVLREKQKEITTVLAQLADRDSELHALQAETSQLTEDKARIESELSAKNDSISRLESDKARIESELSAKNDSISRLESELSRAHEELNAILGSFTYSAIRFFTKRIDRLFPDNTRRGQFRKSIVARLRRGGEPELAKKSGKVALHHMLWISEIKKFGAVSLRIFREEGMHSLLAKAFDKIRKKEFRILEAPPTAERKFIHDEFRNGSTEIFRDFYESMLSVAASHGNHEDQLISKEFAPATEHVKLIAFYLPQFHPIPENDAWWGRGFTEWTNVSKAVPQFVGHYQPRLPGELGFYDLRLIDVQKRQIELARQHGIHGFCFYYYWFDGKRLLDRPLNQLLSHPELDFPFCLCWVNENWTRRWDGMNDHILMAQTYSPGWHIRFVEDIEHALRDKRYIRLNERPILIVYNPANLPSAKAVLEDWKTYSRQRGIGELYIAAAQTFGFVDPRSMSFDAAVEFPPHNIRLRETTNEVELLNPNFGGKVYDYRELVKDQVLTKDDQPYDLFLSVMTGWDNEPRRPGNGHTFAFSTPGLYAKWLQYSCKRTIAKMSPEKRFVFINAWNEWAEGAYLEPDRKWGYAYLEATAAVLRSLSHSNPLSNKKERNNPQQHTSPFVPAQVQKRHDTAVIVHIYYPELFEELWAYLENLTGDFDLFVSIPNTVSFADEKIRRRHANAYIYRCENRGRDIAPFLRIFSYLQPFKYEYMCKVHSKKTEHRIDGGIWRRDIYSKLLGSAETVSKVKAALGQTHIGIVAAAGHVLPSEYYWGLGDANKRNVSDLCERLRMNIGDLRFTFVAGSMFWFKPRALDLLTQLTVRGSDFPVERGQTDGTLAHAFERFLGLLAEQSGFTIAEVDKEGHIRTPRFVPGRVTTYPWASATKNGRALASSDD